jgi:hypothetical protein
VQGIWDVYEWSRMFGESIIGIVNFDKELEE